MIDDRERVAPSGGERGRPAGRGALSRHKCSWASTRWGCEATGPAIRRQSRCLPRGAASPSDRVSAARAPSRCIAPMPPLASPRMRSLCSYWILVARYIGSACARATSAVAAAVRCVVCAAPRFDVYSSSLEMSLLVSELLVGAVKLCSESTEHFKHSAYTPSRKRACTWAGIVSVKVPVPTSPLSEPAKS